MVEDTILEVGSLRTSFITDANSVQSVRGITFRMGRGESLEIIRGSSCEKSVTILPVIRLLEDSTPRQMDVLLFSGKNLLKRSPEEMRRIQGSRIGMISQDPMTSLNPLLTVGEQIRGPLICHRKSPRKEAEAKALVMLKAIGLPSPECRLKQYPYELSGGMHQRVMIIIAICCKPELLIANEPTTTLDMTIQTQALELMVHMKNEFNTSVILITHDPGVISSLCTGIIVMYGGLIMEKGNIEDIFCRTGHPYTTGLLASIPKRTKEKLVPVFGAPSGLLSPSKGCPSTARCSRAMKFCATRQSPFCNLGNRHISACWLHNESVKAWMGEVRL